MPRAGLAGGEERPPLQKGTSPDAGDSGACVQKGMLKLFSCGVYAGRIGAIQVVR